MRVGTRRSSFAAGCAVALAVGGCGRWGCGGAPSHAHCVPGEPVGLKCDALGFDGGELRCTAEGQIDPSACTTHTRRAGVATARPDGCGNGVIDQARTRVCAPCAAPGPCPCELTEVKTEACDGDALDGASCLSQGYLGGRLACSDTCTFDFSKCARLVDGHPFPKTLPVPGIAGSARGAGAALGVALAAVPGEVAAAWVVPAPPPAAGVDERQDDRVVFARAELGLSSWKVTRPFDAGHAGELWLAGNAQGWLLGVANLADAHGGGGPTVRFVPLGPDGHEGAIGARISAPKLFFLARGGPGEPSLAGFPSSAAGGAVDAILLGDDGRVVEGPFRLGAERAPSVAILGASATYAGKGRFLTARGAPVGIELTRVDKDGKVSVLPTAHPELRGAVQGLVAVEDRALLLFSDRGQSRVAVFSAEGELVSPPVTATSEQTALLAGSPAHPEVLAVAADPQRASARVASLVTPGRGAQLLLSVPGLTVPEVADATDAAYALLLSAEPAAVIRLR